MVEHYNTGTCTIRVGHDYVCLNFGSNSAASVSVQDRGTRSEVPSGSACSVTVPNTNCRVHRLPRSFAATVRFTIDRPWDQGTAMLIGAPLGLGILLALGILDGRDVPPLPIEVAPDQPNQNYLHPVHASPSRDQRGPCIGAGSSAVTAA